MGLFLLKKFKREILSSLFYTKYRLRQCLSVFFKHFPALSRENKASNVAPNAFKILKCFIYLFQQLKVSETPKFICGSFFPFLFHRGVSPVHSFRL